MSIPKVSFEETLGKSVLPANCIGCASCVVVCPFKCLEYSKEEPKLVSDCKTCGICAQTCPRYTSFIPDLERFVFNRERKSSEEFGIYRRIVIAQTTNDEILKRCQDGGVVTTLLIYALENRLIEGAAVAGVSDKEPLKAIPQLATTVDELLECAGTKYTYSPNIIAFDKGVQQKKKNLAFVGTPCQIELIRKIQAVPLKKYSEALRVAIGVFCSECFTYEGFVTKLIQKKMGIDPGQVKKINIKGKILVTAKSGEVKTAPLKDAKEYVRKCLHSCTDFSSELADISVGGLGLDGWTLTILRTEKGEELFRKAESAGMIRTRPLEKEDEPILDMLMRFSKKKRENATKSGG
ncbi:MAG: Coenzyme F420 hydrogenase/dehydrogenase, beta subunit C-terminal domain [Candidatus Bathyarchaeia archaeon]